MMRFLHAYAERRPDLTRNVLTRVSTIGAKRLIVFLTPGYEARNGGVMVIASYYRESIALRDIHHARVILCRAPSDPPFLKYSWFENHNYILDLEAVLKRCSALDYLLIHIPAVQVDRMVEWLSSASSTLLGRIRELHLNILVMNIDNIRGKNIAGLKRFGRVTSIAAHESYTNLATREWLDAPLHRLSICCGPEFYSLSGYHEKEPLLIVSPDQHPLREKVLDTIARAHPDLKIQVIRDISYEEYRKLANRAKWALTFGEGLDFYFAETVFSGGVSFAVFNDRYFTPEFSKLDTIYASWDTLLEKMPADLARLDEPEAYHRSWRQPYDLICGLYNVEQFRKNLRLFYRQEYTFP